MAAGAQAQVKTTVSKSATTSPLAIDLGGGPATANGTKAQTFQTAALTIDLAGGATTPASTATLQRLAAQTLVLSINLSTSPPPATGQTVAGTTRQAFTVAALTIDLGTPSGQPAGLLQSGKQSATLAPLVMNFGSQSIAPPSSSKATATTSPLVMTL